jgi:hypothetical protein
MPSRIIRFLALLLVLTPLAHADGTTTMRFVGVNGIQCQGCGLFCDGINNNGL